MAKTGPPLDSRSEPRVASEPVASRFRRRVSYPPCSERANERSPERRLHVDDEGASRAALRQAEESVRDRGETRYRVGMTTLERVAGPAGNGAERAESKPLNERAGRCEGLEVSVFAHDRPPHAANVVAHVRARRPSRSRAVASCGRCQCQDTPHDLRWSVCVSDVARKYADGVVGPPEKLIRFGKTIPFRP
jgi:hypothetical protein